MFGICPEKTRSLKVKTRRDQHKLLWEVCGTLCTLGEKVLEIGQLTLLYYMSPLLLYLYVITRVTIR
jgi:hypothetical protein